MVNTAFYEAMERGDFGALSALWFETEVSCVHPGWPVLSAAARCSVRTR